MHRKDLVGSELRSLFLLLAVILSTFGCLAATTPDPDLFDGRVAQSETQSGGAGPAEGAGGASGQSGGGESGSSGGGGEAGSETEDPGSVGDSGGGQPVKSQRSKTGSPGGSSGEILPQGGPGGGGGGSQGGQSGGNTGGSPGGESNSEASEPSGSTGAGEPIERKFEDFGFGGVGARERVEVNRSKESGQSTSSNGNNMRPDSANPDARGDDETAEGSQATTGSKSGDYGTNLPSGL